MSGYNRLLAALAIVVCTATASPASQVDIPLRIDHAFIRQVLLTQVYTAPNDSAVPWDTGTGCGYLKLREPAVSTAGNRLRVVTRGEARIGTAIGAQCVTAVHWNGFIEVFEEPRILPDERTLAFRVVQSNLYDSTWKKRLFTGKLWDLIKQYVHPRLEEVRVNLNEPVQDVRDLLPMVVARGDAERIQATLDSLRLSAATATDAGVTVTLSFTVNPATPPAGPTPEPTLTAEELRRWEEAWQRWDAFLTFTVKQLGGETSVQELRQALADVLIDSRFDILEALAPSAPGAPDPTRTLFLKAWERLTPVVRNSATTQPGVVALRYLSFIAAGDALAALDQLGPDIGLEISADGLRRLARIVAPASTEDPLLYSTTIDADLRQLFGFGAPLPAPDLTDAPGDESWWRRLFATRRAVAADETPSATALQRWLPDRNSIDAYLDAVRAVLDAVTKDAMATTDLHDAEVRVYRSLVRATAWQESCWRQFVRANGKITYIRSPVGSTGMMQINEHVWRGFYDLRGLRWDIHYNGRAGSEILLHYLQDYAIAHNEEAQPGGLDNVARATYAVYNGGPGHLTRYRKRNTKRSLRLIDRAFWEKYRAVAAGKDADVARCIVGG
jgi:soluble lytic murein transglycosylase-like protein